MIDLSIVIVNWNSGSLLRNCLTSIETCLKHGTSSFEIVVVDNASSDESLPDSAEFSNVLVLRNGENRGFGAACNAGARRGTGRYLLFLNPDCEVRHGSIERCMAEFLDPEVGVCGVALESESGEISRTCYRFPRLKEFCYRIFGMHLLSSRWNDGAMTYWGHGDDATVDHVIGAFYMVRKSFFDHLGGFDERFFVYLEDLDFSLRVNKEGAKIRFLAQPASFHVGGGSSRNAKAARIFYATSSRIIYAFKHFPRWQAYIHVALTLLVEPIARTVLHFFRGSFGDLKENLRGFIMLYSNLRRIFRASFRQ